jgi:uncharacterized protein (TIGR01732 family)
VRPTLAAGGKTIKGGLFMFGYGRFGYGCGYGFGGFALIVVLFILFIIVGQLSAGIKKIFRAAGTRSAALLYIQAYF